MSDAFTAAHGLLAAGFAAWLGGLWVVTGFAKSRGLGREGDARKVSHIAALAGGAVALSWLPEAPARVCLYVVSAEILVLVVVACRFRDRPLVRLAFAANARQSDAPHEAYFVWSSWLMGLVALVGIDLAFGSMAVTRTAALVLGIADGVAEPIGRRYGRHRYRVPSWDGRASYRSAEGSLAVFATTLAVVLVCTAPASAGAAGWGLVALGTALAVTGTEALSPRGTDNFAVLVVAGICVWVASVGAEWTRLSVFPSPLPI